MIDRYYEDVTTVKKKKCISYKLCFMQNLLFDV